MSIKIPKITIDEWLRELERTSNKEPIKGLSLNEFADKLSISSTTAKWRMRILIDSKKWKCKGKRGSVGIDGRVHRNTPIYGPIKEVTNE